MWIRIILGVLIFGLLSSCSVFVIPDTSKDKELECKADSTMNWVDSLIINLDDNIIIESDTVLIDSTWKE
jgi:hypothetical protein